MLPYYPARDGHPSIFDLFDLDDDADVATVAPIHPIIGTATYVIWNLRVTCAGDASKGRTEWTRSR